MTPTGSNRHAAAQSAEVSRSNAHVCRTCIPGRPIDHNHGVSTNNFRTVSCTSQCPLQLAGVVCQTPGVSAARMLPSAFVMVALPFSTRKDSVVLRVICQLPGVHSHSPVPNVLPGEKSFVETCGGPEFPSTQSLWVPCGSSFSVKYEAGKSSVHVSSAIDDGVHVDASSKTKDLRLLVAHQRRSAICIATTSATTVNCDQTIIM